MKKLIEQTQRIEQPGDAAALVHAMKTLDGCVFAYARKSTDGDGEPDEVVSLHDAAGNTIPRQRQRRAYVPDL